METPTSIWLANQDYKALQSSRLQLLGETKEKELADRQTEVRDQVLNGEADPLTTTESTMDIVDDDAQDLAKDSQSGGLGANEKAAPRSVSLKRSIQVWIPLTFPEVPKKGGWDVSRLRESKYFFS